MYHPQFTCNFRQDAVIFSATLNAYYEQLFLVNKRFQANLPLGYHEICRLI